MSTFDPDRFKVSGTPVDQMTDKSIATKKVSPVSKQQQFLKGPVPLPWLIKASRCKGQAFIVAIIIWYRCGLQKSNQVTLTSRVLGKFGINRSAKSRALLCLEEAGLIQVERQHGKNPVITILEVDE
jgi:hypothetical protein